MALLFEDAAKAKDAIMASQQKEIRKLYDDWADDVAERAKLYSHKTNASAAVSERYYKELYAQMRETGDQVSKEVQGLIVSNMYTIADSVVASNVNWLKSFGFSERGLNAAFSYIPNDVVQRLVTGKVYQGGWNLSQRIWSDSQQAQRDVYQIMARGLAEQKSVYEIAKDLESYVRPSAKLKWNPVLATKNTSTGRIEYKRIYKKQVDYNAQRLARTLVQHSYQQSFVATTKDNPFITEYIWRSNGSRVCPLCLARDGAVFKKTELPMDHPNGMCTMEPVVVKDMVDQLADWFNSPDGTYPEIDAFAGNFGYEAAKGGTVDDFIAKYGKSTKSPNAWFNSLTPVQKAEAKLLKEQSGLTWNKWYEKNIYSGSGLTVKQRVKSGIPDYKTWIGKIRKQDEAYMLAKEEKWMRLIGEKGKRGIKAYSGSDYEEMNGYLRYLQRGFSESDAIARSGISSRQLEYVKDAMNGLNNVKLDEDFVLRRGSSIGDIAGLFMSGDYRANKNLIDGMSADELNNMFQGAIGNYGSFTSTSSIWEKGFRGRVETIIYAPAGTSASSIMSISEFGTGEGETLLNAGTSVRCVKIEESDGHKSSRIRLFLEIITK